MRLGIIQSMTLTRNPPRLVLAFTGGIAGQVMNFDTEAEVLGKYDELVAIEEAQKNVE
jgi:hypothetical protein